MLDIPSPPPPPAAHSTLATLICPALLDVPSVRAHIRPRGHEDPDTAHPGGAGGVISFFKQRAKERVASIAEQKVRWRLGRPHARTRACTNAPSITSVRTCPPPPASRPAAHPPLSLRQALATLRASGALSTFPSVALCRIAREGRAVHLAREAVDGVPENIPPPRSEPRASVVPRRATPPRRPQRPERPARPPREEARAAPAQAGRDAADDSPPSIPPRTAVRAAAEDLTSPPVPQRSARRRYEYERDI